MTYKDYAATIEFDPDDEIFIGHLAGINGIIGFHADTVSSLTAAFHEAVDDYIETCARIGKPPQKSYSGQITVRVDPQVHAPAARAAELSDKSLAKWTEESCATRRRGGRGRGYATSGPPLATL